MQLQSDLSGFETGITESLKDSYADNWDEKISNKINGEIEGSRETLKNRLLAESPYIGNRAELILAQRDQRYYGGCKQSILQDLGNYKKLCPQIDGSFWLKKRKTESDNWAASQKKKTSQKKIAPQNPAEWKKQDTKIRRNLQDAWRRDYEKLEMEWELNEIDNYRKELILQYSQWLDKIREISKALNALGLECGLLWDLSIGSLSDQDISRLLEWADYLRDNEEVKKLCELMGKMKRESQSFETVRIQTTQSYEVHKKDLNSREEITGIRLGSDLESLVPQELSFLTDPELAILFDLKFVENRLMCFQREGIQTVLEEKFHTEEKQVEIVDKKGPVIICVDTSGSMSGAPETIAKALTLLLATQAADQKRPCYLINFSTGIETTDLKPPKGIKDLIGFLQKSFHGGTDVAPALFEAVAKMESEEFSKADLLVISDFVLSINDEHLRDTIAEQKQNENRFYALSIGRARIDSVDDLFDLQWNYDASSGTISQLNNVVELISTDG